VNDTPASMMCEGMYFGECLTLVLHVSYVPFRDLVSPIVRRDSCVYSFGVSSVDLEIGLLFSSTTPPPSGLDSRPSVDTSHF
jgi:hypothetical protein